jgi:hypothetical protein
MGLKKRSLKAAGTCVAPRQFLGGLQRQALTTQYKPPRERKGLNPHRRWPASLGRGGYQGNATIFMIAKL